MAKKKGVKKSMAKKSVMMDSSMSCNCDRYWGRGYGMVKLASMAFILFLITVWPAAMNLVHRIHWGWFLGATILFGAIAMKRLCWMK